MNVACMHGVPSRVRPITGPEALRSESASVTRECDSKGGEFSSLRSFLVINKIRHRPPTIAEEFGIPTS